MSSLMFKFKLLNWDAIDNMSYKPFITRTRLWNWSSELFQTLSFGSKEDLQYAINCNLISYNLHLVVCES